MTESNELETLSQPKTDHFSDLSILKLSFNEVKTQLDKSLEPDQELGRCLEVVKQLTSNLQSGKEFENAALEQFVWQEMLPGIAKRIVKVSITKKKSFETIVQNLINAIGELFETSLKTNHRRGEDMASAMRELLDPSAKFYQFHFQHELGENASRAAVKVDFSRFTDIDRSWRENLKKGDLVDCLKDDKNFNVDMWARGQISDVVQGTEAEDAGNKYFKVRFLHDVQVPERTIRADSSRIAPLDSMCGDDITWRSSLKKGDLVDALDRSNQWYLSTIVQPEERPNATMPLAKVGFRVYHPEGDKDDSMGRFFGYSETCDEFIGQFTVRIQKPRTFTQEVKFEDLKSSANPKPTKQESKPQERVFVDTEQDELDLGMLGAPGQIIFAVQRESCKSKTLVSLLNRLGDVNVFEAVLTQLARPETTLEHTFYLNDCFGKCSKLLHKSFVDSFFTRYQAAVETKLLSATETQLRSIRFQRIEELISTLWEKLMTRIYSSKEAKVRMNMLNFDVGHMFLQQNFLEKRIDGAKLISGICNNFKSLSVTSTLRSGSQEFEMRKTLVSKLKEKNILSDFFSKTQAHMQLVARSEGLLRVMLVDDHASREDLEMIWNASKIDESLGHELYRVFHEMGSCMGSHELSFFIDKIVSMPLEAVRDYEVSLLQKFLEARCIDENSFETALNFLFRLIASKPEQAAIGTVRVSLQKAARAFSEVFEKAPYALVVQYFHKFQMSLQQDQQAYLTVSILHKYLSSFLGREGFPNSRAQLVDDLEKDFAMLGAVLENFKHYLTQVRAVLLAKGQNNLDGLSKKAIVGDFPHETQVLERLQLISVYITAASTKLTSEQIGLLWDQLVTMSSLPEEQELFYRWLKHICDQIQCNSFDIIAEETLVEFFKEKTSDPEADFSNISLEGYQCIQSFFILSNSRARRLILLDDPSVVEQKAKQTWTSYSNDTGAQYASYSFNKTTETQTSATTASTTNKDASHVLEIQVRTAPSQMEGIESLWKIARDCKNKEVSDSVNNLLLQLHTNVDFGMEQQISEFEDIYVARCKQIIKEQLALINARDEATQNAVNEQIASLTMFGTAKVNKLLPQEERRIIRTLQKVKVLISNSEKDGMHGLRPHSTLSQGELIKIKVNNQVCTGSEFRSSFEVQCLNKITVFELKRIISVQLAYKLDAANNWVLNIPVHPCSFKIGKYGDSPLKDSQNGCTLNELGFKDKTSVNVQPKGMHSVSKVPLLNDDKTALNARAMYVFTQMFEHYSIVDPDQPDRKIMTADQIMEFVKGATQEHCLITDSRIVSLMSWDSDADGKLTMQDFLQFYFDSVFEKETIVRQNLIRHNFRSDLKQAPKDGDPENILQTRQSYLQMPRYKLSTDEEWLDLLFQLQDQQYHVAYAARNVGEMLCTSPRLFWKLLGLKKDSYSNETFEWATIFESGNVNKLLYTLHIVEAYLQNDFSSLDQNSEEAKLRKDWLLRFLQAGGFEQLDSLLKKALDSLETDYSALQATQARKIAATSHINSKLNRKKEYLDFILRLYKAFVWAGLQSEQTEEIAMILFKRTSNQTDLNDPKSIEDVPQTPRDTKSAPPQTIPLQGPYRGVPFVNNSAEPFIGPELPASGITMDFLFGKDESESTQKAQEDKPISLTNETDKIDFESSERFKGIVQELRESGFGKQIVEQVNFRQMQSQLLSTICLLVVENDYNKEEHAIIESAFDLWSASIVKNNELVEDFYVWKRTPTNEQDTISNVDEFFTKLVFCPKAQKVRDCFKNSMIALCEHVKQFKTESPLQFVLRQLRKNYPVEDTIEYEDEKSKKEDGKKEDVKRVDKYFELFRFVVKQLNNDHSLSFDFVTLFDQVFPKFCTHVSREQDYSVILEDGVLTGNLLLIKELLLILLEKNPYQVVLDIEEKHQFLHELFFENLYYMPGKTRSVSQNKCKTRKSRLLAYQLLYKYLKALEAKEMALFLENYLWPFVKDLSRPVKWQHQPSGKTRLQYAGINNPGNVCYMISMLQQFYMVPQFRYLLMNAVDESPEDLQEFKGQIHDDNLIRQLQKLFGSLEMTERQSVDPTGFCLAYKDLDGKPTNTAIQCDAQEFLNIFYDRLENLLEKTSQKYLLQDVFRGQHCQQLVCKSCGFTTRRTEFFYTLSVEVRNKHSLDESLNRNFEGDEISDFKCDGCLQKVNVAKKLLLGKAPNTLIVHLQRIVFSFETYNNEKINSKLEFPQILDLNRHSFRQKMTLEGKSAADFEADSEERSFMEQHDDDFVYRLVGVNIHNGTADHGHYFSVINVNRGEKEPDPNKELDKWMQVEKDTWRKFDDDENLFFFYKELAGESFGGDMQTMNEKEMETYLTNTNQKYGKSAYMLVYERKSKNPIRQLVKLDPEEVVSIPFREVPKYVPKQIQAQVAKDNTDFVIDRQVFNDYFFYLVKLTLSHIGSELLMKQHKFDVDYALHFHKLKTYAMQLGHKVVLDFLSHFNENGSIGPIVDATATIATFSDTYVNFTTQSQSVLMQTLQTFFLDDSCQYFFNVMFNCINQKARQQCGKLASNLVNKAFRIYGILQKDEKLSEHPRVVELGKMLHDFMTLVLLKLQERDCQKNWSRLDGYFQMIHDIGTGGSTQSEYFLNGPDLLVQLVDFMLGNKSPKAKGEPEARVSMGGSISAPFAPLVALASHLVCCMHSDKMNDSSLPSPKTFSKFRNEAKLQDQPVPLTKRFDMSAESYEFFVNPDFFDLVLRGDYAAEKFAKAVAHLCFNNKKLSKWVSLKVLRGVVNNDYTQIKAYLTLIEHITLLKDHCPGTPFEDTLQRKRLEWIFGFPFLTFIQGSEPTKFGLSSLFHSVKGEPYVLNSMLSDDPATDQSMLNLLFRYQGRIDTHVVSCLDHLMRIVADDREIQQYFSQLPGLTYQHARYTDWIGPYLQSLLNQASPQYNSTSHESIVKVQSNFEVYSDYLKQLNQTGAEDAQMEATQENNVIRCNPQPIMILRGEDENYCGVIEKDGVLLSVTMVRCSFVESQPTGFTNLSVPAGFWTKYQHPEGSKSAAAMLKDREKQMQDSAIKTGSSFKNRLAQAKADDKAAAKVIQDENEQWSHINKTQSDEEVGGEGYRSEKEEDRETKEDSKESPLITAQDAKADARVEPPKELDDSFEDASWAEIPVRRCDDLVYKFSVSNQTDTPIFFKIKLAQKAGANLANLNWPRTGIKGPLNVGETAIAALLSKTTPSETDIIPEIEKLDMFLTWKVDEAKFLRDATKATKEDKKKNAVTFGPTATIDTTVEVPEALPYIPEEEAFGGEKQCDACTMFNPKDATSCFICTTAFNN